MREDDRILVFSIMDYYNDKVATTDQALLQPDAPYQVTYPSPQNCL